jgi:putative endonuclease
MAEGSQRMNPARMVDRAKAIGKIFRPTPSLRMTKWREYCLAKGQSGKRKSYFVYIMSNTSKMLHTGVTNDLDVRVFQHKYKRTPGFTQKYNLHKLVYFEAFGNVREAIRREKQIKGWIRSKKVALIESRNPYWDDLAEEHSKSAERFRAISVKGIAIKSDTTKPGDLSS